MNAATIITAAIRAQQQLSFLYDGHARMVEPHTFGLDKRHREVLCGYQTAGASTSGKPVGWKFFLIAKISALRPSDDHFSSPRPEYQRNDGAFLRIDAQL